MVLWGAAFGGLVGWLLAYFEFFGLVLGVIIGALGGWWLKSVVRSLARQGGVTRGLEIRIGRGAWGL